MNEILKIGIINCHTGKTIAEKVMKNKTNFTHEEKEFQKEALNVLKRMLRWFDKRHTFFSGTPLWKHWEKVGIISKFRAVIEGRSNLASESISVFKDWHSRGVEHEIYIERLIDTK